MEKLAVLAVKLFGPVQLKVGDEAVDVAVSVSVCPAQIGLLLAVMVGVGAAHPVISKIR
jgi:hypothetical protein